MTFIQRPLEDKTVKLVREALISPHAGGNERFDPEFPVAHQCNRCGRIGYGPRKHLRDALKAHWEEDCPARRTRADAPMEMRLLYPKVKE